MTADAPPPVAEVVVRATRLPDPVGDAAFSIVRIGEEALRATPRLDEALESVPGVSLFRRNSSLSANPTVQGVSLRSIAGSGAGRALVTLDGVPQGDPFGGWVIWSALPQQTIGAISIVRGAGAGPYGAGALTGVIDLSSRDLAPGQVAGEASAGNLGDRQGQGVAALALGPGVLSLAAAGESADGYIPVRAGRGAADTRLDLHAYSGAARWVGPLGADVVSIRAAGYNEDRGSGLQGAVSRADGGQVSVSLTRPAAGHDPAFQLRAWVDRSNLLNTSVTVAPGRATATLSDDQYATPATGYGVGGLLRWTVGTGAVELGADARGTVGESQELFKYVAGQATRQRFSGGQTVTGGAYLEGSQSFGHWLITGGARLDGWGDLASHRLEFNTATGAATVAQRLGDQGGVVPTGRLAVRRELGMDLYLRAATYAGFRPATLNELDRPFRVGSDVTEANPALRPERLYGAEIGAGGRWLGAQWDATGFYNRLGDAVINATVRAGPFTDPVEGVIPAGGTLFQRRNVDHIDAWGLEASAKRDWGRIGARVAADYTYARVDGGTAAPALTGLRPAETPRLSVTVGASWRPVDRLTLLAEARYDGARFDDDLNTRRLAPGETADLRADVQVTRAVSVFAAAENLFDAAIQTGRTADNTVSYGPPRLIRVGVTVRPR
jgi:outer membrane receptor protein involved in Fe transport